MKAFMSVMTAAVLESRCVAMTVAPAGSVDTSQSTEMVILLGFPDGAVVHSDGRIEIIDMAHEGKASKIYALIPSQVGEIFNGRDRR